MTPLERQLFEAVGAGDLTAVRAALAAGADVNAIDYTGETGWAGDDAVEVAAHLGHADIVRELIAAGSRNRSFIDTAIGERHPEVVRAWLESIGNERLRHLNGGDEEGVTPLMLAAHVGSPAVVRLLLEAGADPTLEDDDGDTALARAERGREEACGPRQPGRRRTARWRTCCGRRWRRGERPPPAAAAVESRVFSAPIC